ncbi:MAG: DUF937 domain-containing protein [Verrucomicrobiales bacterium]|nr:DUF937 domain-containing protein [Verrucomicrobiae bacterium]
MSSFLEQLIASQGSKVSRQITEQFGVSPEKTDGLLSEIGPMVLGGLKSQAQSGGTDLLGGFLGQGESGGGSLLGPLDGLLGGGEDSVPEEGQSLAASHAPTSAVEGILGSFAPQIIEAISDRLGVSKSKAKEILPLIVGAVTKFLSEEGGGLSGLMSMLDKDGDGSVMDDVADMLGGSKGISDLLGGLMGAK